MIYQLTLVLYCGFGINPGARFFFPRLWSLWPHCKAEAFVFLVFVPLWKPGGPSFSGLILGCLHVPLWLLEQRALTSMWFTKTERGSSFYHSSRTAPLGTGPAVLTSTYSWHIPGSRVTWLKEEMPLCRWPPKGLDDVHSQRSTGVGDPGLLILDLPMSDVSSTWSCYNHTQW